MYFAGVDVGALTTKVVILEDGKIGSYAISRTGVEVKKSVEDVFNLALKKLGISREQVKSITATGYGRNIATVFLADKKVTEITCHAKGAKWLFPTCRTVIDVGGQDSKVIRLDKNGKVVDFAMNDKCAAGTGRFLEVMANALEVNLSELGKLSLQSKNKVNITSTCTVFAESEVISLLAEGKSKVDIIAGLHDAIATRLAGLVGNVGGVVPDVVMTGGVAKNIGIIKALEKKLNCKILLPDEPQIVGALGAALISANL